MFFLNIKIWNRVGCALMKIKRNHTTLFPPKQFVCLVTLFSIDIIGIPNVESDAYLLQCPSVSGGARGPGVFFIVPCVDIVEIIDMRVQTFNVPPQEVTEYKLLAKKGF